MRECRKKIKSSQHKNRNKSKCGEAVCLFLLSFVSHESIGARRRARPDSNCTVHVSVLASEARYRRHHRRRGAARIVPQARKNREHSPSQNVDAEHLEPLLRVERHDGLYALVQNGVTRVLRSLRVASHLHIESTAQQDTPIIFVTKGRWGGAGGMGGGGACAVRYTLILPLRVVSLLEIC